MKNTKYIKLSPFILGVTILSVMLPIILTALWACARRWPWPHLLPDGFSARGANELFGSYSNALQVLFSSMAISLTVAFAAVLIGLMTARAFAFYDFSWKPFLRFASMLPIIVPASVFAMGIHVTCIRLGVSDSLSCVIVCHVIYALPYTISILTETIEAIGVKYEQQASMLGCGPVRAFLSVTLPLTLPAILSSVSMAYIISFSQYFLTLLLGGGKVKTFSVIMVPFIADGDRTVASSYAMMFVLSSLLVFAAFEYLAEKSVKALR